MEQKASKKQKLTVDSQVSMSDFMQALDEVKPAFGVDSKSLDNAVRGGLYLYGPQMHELFKQC